jgi:hypothetical protein
MVAVVCVTYTSQRGVCDTLTETRAIGWKKAKQEKDEKRRVENKGQRWMDRCT